MILGYIRVSSDKQVVQQQKHTLLEWSQKNKILIDDFIEVEASTKKSASTRKIDELLSRLNEGDELVTVELSRLGRNMLEVLNLLNELDEKQISVTFVRQPELSTGNRNPQSKLMLAIYSYFAEAERDFISQRTKSGLEAARAKGKKLGRPKGARNKERLLDPYRPTILEFLKIGMNISGIHKVVQSQSDKPVQYATLRLYIESDPELKRARANYQKGSLLK